MEQLHTDLVVVHSVDRCGGPSVDRSDRSLSLKRNKDLVHLQEGPEVAGRLSLPRDLEKMVQKNPILVVKALRVHLWMLF